MHYQFSKLHGNYFSYITKRTRWWICTSHCSLTFQCGLLLVPSYMCLDFRGTFAYSNLFWVATMWLKWFSLCTSHRGSRSSAGPSLLAWMWKMNPKWVCMCFTPSTCPTFLFATFFSMTIWPTDLVCFLGALQRPHHTVAQTNKRRAVDLLSAPEDFKGSYWF